MKNFFPMSKGEARMLAFLIVMAVISFLPMWRRMEIGGMAVFGWLLAALMITAPLLALLMFRRAERAKVDERENESPSSSSRMDPES